MSTIKHKLYIGVLALALPYAALAKDITVNTTADEKGEGSSCSLREAVISANTYKPYGGCQEAGEPNFTSYIYLEGGKTYQLTDEIVVPGTGKITIKGGTLTSTSNGTSIQLKGANIPYLKDEITHQLPQRVEVTTTIQGAGASRLFSTETSRAPLTLDSLILSGGNATAGTTALGGTTHGYGGTILAGGFVSLNRVEIKKSTATISGGAIYLAGSASGLNLSAVSITDSSANGTVSLIRPDILPTNKNIGASAIGMSCEDGLLLTARDITIENSSIYNNTSPYATIDVCGMPTAKITNTTIADNTLLQAATGRNGAALRYLGTFDASQLGRQASMELNGVTLMGNKGNGLLYDGSGGLSISASALAFQENAGKSCVYQEAVSTSNKPIKIYAPSLKFNLLQGVLPSKFASKISTQLDCELPVPTSYDASQSTNKAATFYNSRMTGVETKESLFEVFDNYGAWLPGYLPKDLSKGSTSKDNLVVDQGGENQDCGLDYDQRGVSRRSGFNDEKFVVDKTPRCDIGALELAKVTANDIIRAQNQSYYKAVTGYKPLSEVDKKAYDDLNAEDKATVDEEDRLYRLKLALLKKYSFYRVAIVPIFDDVILPEYATAAGSEPKNKGYLHAFAWQGDQYLDSESLDSVVDIFANPKLEYGFVGVSQGGGSSSISSGIQVSTKTYSTDIDWENKSLDTLEAISKGITDDNTESYCRYVDQLKAVVVWRKDPLSTSGTSRFEHCVYEVKYPDQVASKGLIQASITNVAPIAKDDTFDYKEFSVTTQFDVLKNDTDEGDGPCIRENVTDAQIAYKDVENVESCVQVNATLQRPLTMNGVVYGESVTKSYDSAKDTRYMVPKEFSSKGSVAYGRNAWLFSVNENAFAQKPSEVRTVALVTIANPDGSKVVGVKEKVAPNAFVTVTWPQAGASSAMSDSEGNVVIKAESTNTASEGSVTSMTVYTDYSHVPNGVRIKKQPTLGHLTWDYETACPATIKDRVLNEKCYGGKVTYTVDNTFNPFDDEFEYVLIDRNGLESNTAKVKIINTRDSRSVTNSGSASIFMIFGLLIFAGLRRFLSSRQ